tara:strand:- start:246 stop:440 length:195 start_codon:yes stop_codon:yes gene_type:complete
MKTKKGLMISEIDPMSLEFYHNKILVTLRHEMRRELVTLRHGIRAMIIEELPNALDMLLANEEE